MLDPPMGDLERHRWIATRPLPHEPELRDGLRRPLGFLFPGAGGPVPADAQRPTMESIAEIAARWPLRAATSTRCRDRCGGQIWRHTLD
mgnify:CR=1 FL=1